jgi:hypothetical protein
MNIYLLLLKQIENIRYIYCMENRMDICVPILIQIKEILLCICTANRIVIP